MNAVAPAAIVDLPEVAAGDKAEAQLSALPEEVRSVYEYMPATLAGYMAGIGVIALLHWAITPASVMLPWLSVFGVIWLGRGWTARQFARAAPQTLADW